MKKVFFRTGQAAKRWGVSLHQVRRLCETGMIDAELRDSGQWAIPLSEIERIEREGVPAVPTAIEDDDDDCEAEPTSEPEEAAAPNGLLAPPSNEVVRSAEQVLVTENHLKRRKLEKELTETNDWFEVRQNKREELMSRKQAEESERSNRQEAENRQRTWRQKWLTIALQKIPTEAPAETRLQLPGLVRGALSAVNLDDSETIIQQLIDAAVNQALQPWKLKQESERAVREACEQLPWGARGVFAQTAWQTRAQRSASAEVSKLPANVSFNEKYHAALAAVEKVSAEFNFDQLRKTVREAFILWDGTSEEREEAKDAVRRALDRLPVGTSQQSLERAREQALAPFHAAIRKRQQDANRQNRIEQSLSHVRKYLDELKRGGYVEFDSYSDLPRLAERVKTEIRKPLLDELRRKELDDQDIKNVIEDMVDEYLEEADDEDED